jgi:hypothetical protein
MTEIDKINDKFFKKIIESKKNTRDFLKKVLPKGIKKHLDFSRIHIDRTNYVSNEFKEGYADFTVKIKMKSKKGKKIPTDISSLNTKVEEKRNYYCKSSNTCTLYGKKTY